MNCSEGHKVKHTLMRVVGRVSELHCMLNVEVNYSMDCKVKGTAG